MSRYHVVWRPKVRPRWGVLKSTHVVRIDQRTLSARSFTSRSEADRFARDLVQRGHHDVLVTRAVATAQVVTREIS